MDWTTAHILAVLLIATVIRAGFGFGEALIAVPLLALVMPVEKAAPLAALVSITVAIVIIAADWHKIHLRSAIGLILPTLLGVPIGLLLLTRIQEDVVKSILAVSIIGFSAYCLGGRGKLELTNDRWVWVFGLVAGILGGAYGMNGPPLVVYGSLRRWSPEHFRATLQGYFLPASIIGIGGYWLAGLWVPEVTHFYVASLPVVILAIAVGHWLNRQMGARSFIAYVHVGLIVIGSILLIQSVWSQLPTSYVEP